MYEIEKRKEESVLQERPRDERPPSAADLLQSATKSLMCSIEIANKLMSVLTGVTPESIPTLQPDNMLNHVGLIDRLSDDLRQRLEDTLRAICG